MYYLSLLKNLAIMKKHFWALLALVALCSCGKESSNKAAMKPIGDLFEAYYEENLAFFPLYATMQGDARYNAELPIDIADTQRAKLKAYYEKYLAALSAYNADKLSENDQMSLKILKWECEIGIEKLKYPEHLMPINQFDALTLMLPQLGSGEGTQPFKTVKDYDDWLSRLSKFTAWADTAVANMRRGMATGWVLPKSVAQKVVPQLAAVIQPIEKSLFYGPIKSLPDSFTAADRTRLTVAFKTAIETHVNLPYQKLHDFFKNEYLPKCRETSGVGALPGGQEYYAFCAKLWTTTNMTPDEIFELGKTEVARIRMEMEKVKEQVGFTGDLKAFFAFVNNNPKLTPYSTGKEVIDNFNAIHKRMEPRLKELFDMVPKSKFEIRQTEAFRAESGSAEYMPASENGDRPGVFFCPVPNPKEYNVAQDEALFLHEAIPGHHYQVSLQQENTDLPKFRRFIWYGAYGEGWALYTESLGKELGLYTDPYQYFGRLGMEMHRSIRLVVDVGMHVKGWTREQAIAYSLENEAETEDNTIAEIERYMVYQGQALSYKIGQLKIREMRTKAEAKQGAKFDIKQFHNETLKYGCLPLAVYEEKLGSF
jgi:uncharacterized protein (DUF885 family)